MMNSLVPGRFTTASIKTPDGGELEVRLTDGGHWQVKAKLVDETDWRSLCRGHLDGSIFDAPSPGGHTPVRVGPLLVDPAGRRVEVRGVELRLAAHEFELIELLATEPGRVFTKQELLRELWGSRGTSKLRSLDSHASRTRCKLRDAGADGFIVNCHGHGYKLTDDHAAVLAASRL
jgi:DNA-binding winged helix-turn-helix (wHTH) protein